MDIQSFDIPTIYFKFWEMANDYHHKQGILPEMELAKHIVENRKTDPILRPKGTFQKMISRVGLKENNNNLAKQLHDWYLTVVYGHPKIDQGSIKLFGLKIKQKDEIGKDGKVIKGKRVPIVASVSKIADFINKYTSFNLLGLNVIQGTANYLLAEALQIAETISKEYLTPGSYAKGIAYYTTNLPNMMGDIGRRGNASVASLIMESHDILHNPVTEELGRNTKIRQLDSSALHMFTTGGEHAAQGKFLFGMLKDRRALDKDGKDIGSVLDYYTAENGHLIFDKDGKVDKELSSWTDKDQFNFNYKIKGILSRIHGAYGALEKIALQRGAGGSMLYMFRKFVLPGYKRRYGKKAYIERLDDYVEGSYRTTANFAGRLLSDLYSMKFQLLAGEWDQLSDHEKANVRRTISEAAFLVLALAVAKVALAAMGDEDDDEWDDRFNAFIAYQAGRMKSELLFFISPKEAFSILRSPAASISMIENVGKLFSQMFNPFDTYERGPWKGKPKIYKTMNNMLPGTRQYFRLRDMKEQTTWFTDDIRVPEWLK